MKAALAVASLLLAELGFAGAITSTWNGGTGNWSDSGDWTPNTVPNNGGGNNYQVNIGTGNDLVDLDLSPTVIT